MATLKVFDGTSWQVVAGQGPPGMGAPAGGAAGTFLAKNTAANNDTSWTDAYMRLVTGTLCLNTVPAAPINVARLRVNALPAGWGEGYPAYGSVQATASQSNIPAVSLHGRTDQVNGVLWATDSGGTVRGGFDKTGRPAQFIQAGNTVGNTDPNGLIYISFPEPFLSIPVVVCSETQDIRAFAYSINANQSTTGFLCRVVYHDGLFVNGGVRINWIAFENRGL